MQVINPIYSRLFAADFSAHLSSFGVQHIKQSHLFSAYQLLANNGLAFVEGSPMRLNAASSILFLYLQERSSRVSQRYIWAAAKEALLDKYRFMRIPFFVDQADLDSTDVLEGRDKDDEYWCKTQWIPWLEEKGMTVNDMLNKLKGRRGLTTQEWQDARTEVINDYLTFGHMVDFINDTQVGKVVILDRLDLIKQIDEGIIDFLEFFRSQMRLLAPGGLAEGQSRILSDLAVAFRRKGLSVESHLLGKDSFHMRENHRR